MRSCRRRHAGTSSWVVLLRIARVGASNAKREYFALWRGAVSAEFGPRPRAAAVSWSDDRPAARSRRTAGGGVRSSEPGAGSDDAEGEHGVGDPDEAGDIGARGVAAGGTVVLGGLQAA